MTTPEVGFPSGTPAELAHADLVGRLAREIYGQGQAASAPFAPTLPAGPQVPQALDAFPSAPAPAGATPSGIEPGLSALGARSFGAPPVGLPGVSGPSVAKPLGANSGPASANVLDLGAIAPVHPLSDPLRPKSLPEYAVPSLRKVAAGLPGGTDLYRQIAADHPRAYAFAQAVVPALVPADPSRAGVDVAQEHFEPTGRLSGPPGQEPLQ